MPEPSEIGPNGGRREEEGGWRRAGEEGSAVGSAGETEARGKRPGRGGFRRTTIPILSRLPLHPSPSYPSPSPPID